jgi:2-C-methyl-D-erythritol 4-phosphate cytidylyltransferase/2-C-methyl-D-erythritol 2,4-cyclodiphosphate synthase
VIVVLPADLAAAPPEWLTAAAPRIRVVQGGERRQDSVANGFDALSESCELVLVHDAARPFVTEAVITRAIDAAVEYGAAIAAVPVSDTVKRVTREAGPRIIETIPRETVYLAQTPQAFRREVLQDAVRLGRSGVDATDEAALAEQAGHAVRVVEGDPDNVKVTTARDMDAAKERARAANQVRISGRVGVGYDLHRLVDKRPLVLGGVTVPSDRGALGHSDADVVCHAATDAILGAASLGDIGRHFPDTDPQWRNASSLELLGRVAMLVRQQGFCVGNLDITVVLEQPKIGPYVERIREAVADAIGVPTACVSVKGKTNEGVDAVGRGEAIAAHAVALLGLVDD